VWTPGEQREAVLDEFERSGLPASKFAAHIGVKYPTFASWVQKHRKPLRKFRSSLATQSNPPGTRRPAPSNKTKRSYEVL
jgi:transposase